jgi:hypothetical protein
MLSAEPLSARDADSGTRSGLAPRGTREADPFTSAWPFVSTTSDCNRLPDAPTTASVQLAACTSIPT